MTTILETYSLKKVNSFTLKKFPEVDFVDPDLLFGVEFEIEHTGHKPYDEISGITFKEDGSLRNNGMEFITKPMAYRALKPSIESFFRFYEWDDHNYSERTSIHVHANCQDLTFQQLSSILLQYQVFEKLLYTFVGGDRDKNIFCVPWSETQLNYNVVTKLQKNDTLVVRRWQKYTGLNLLPLETQGTIEFRQMPGIHDVDKILAWIGIIGSMFAYARKHSMEDIEKEFTHLNTSSAYGLILDKVFGQYAERLKTPGYEELLEAGVLNIKYMLLDKGRKTQSAAIRKGQALLETLNEVRRNDPRAVDWPYNLEEFVTLHEQAEQDRLEADDIEHDLL